MHLPSVSEIGYAGLFAWILAEQLGVPIPAMPVILAAGTLVASGKFGLLSCVGLILVACLLADGIWYYLGRSKGVHILHFVCRLSWKPNTCISQTKGVFMRYGASALLFAKFVPGLNTLAPPLAGAVGISARRFFAYDAAGSLFWGLLPLLAGLGLGAAMPDPARIGAFLQENWAEVLACVVGAFLLWTFAHRRIYLYQLGQELKKAVTVEALKEMLDRGEDLVLLDIRHPINFKLRPVMLPGARHVGYQEIEANNLEKVPMERSLIVYCDCPRDQASAHVVRMLRRRGAKSVRLLHGGLEAWEKLGMPTVPAEGLEPLPA
ncbi:MAG: VTT domain-containing protein [Verrucomicrobium sp.]|nr:VTT domain-containing protein [Verrucomicrobium sp.]